MTASATCAAQPADMTAMRQALADRRTTASALVDVAIARAEAANAELNFIALPTFDRARDQAATSRPGPLGGIPTLIKDAVMEKGVPAYFGSEALRGFTAPDDSLYTRAITASGLISIARSTMPELGLNVVTESPLCGATRNPWNTDYAPGGSSGGASAAVAAGVVPAAHATDGLGSIRHGAGPCGLVGLKPSRGRNFGDEAMRSISDLNVSGCVTRTVRDTALWLDATQSRDFAAPFAPVPLAFDPIDTPLRIHAYSAVMRTGNAADASVTRVFGDTIDLLTKLGHQVSDGRLPFDGSRAIQTLQDITEAMFSRRLGLLAEAIGMPIAIDRLEHRSQTLIAAGNRIDDERYESAQRHAENLASAYLAGFDHMDIWMTPTFSTEPVRVGAFSPNTAWEDQREALLDYAGYCWIDNFAGSTAISLPMGFSGNGIPIGIQFATRPGGEALLLALAYQLEAVAPWWQQKPPLWLGD